MPFILAFSIAELKLSLAKAIRRKSSFVLPMALINKNVAPVEELILYYFYAFGI